MLCMIINGTATLIKTTQSTLRLYGLLGLLQNLFGGVRKIQMKQTLNKCRKITSEPCMCGLC